jgi:hypothetical protein
VRDAFVVDRLEESEPSGAYMMVPVVRQVDVRSDPADVTSAAARDQRVDLEVAEHRALRRIEELHPVAAQRLEVMWIAAIDRRGDVEKAPAVAPRAKIDDVDLVADPYAGRAVAQNP